jgi:membrane protein DedA with SNARE-associated domain
MSLTLQGDVANLISTYGYWAIAGAIALESIGLPLPGEATLIVAAVLAGVTHDLSIWFVVSAAAAGTAGGASLGYWIGREIGFRLAVRYGSYIGLTEARLKLGQYMFSRHGGKVVFFGRFLPVLRALGAVLAGLNYMQWSRFIVSNVAGSVAWAAIYGFGAWYLGKEISRIAEPGLIALGIVALIAAAAGLRCLARHEARLQRQADAALPGPLRGSHQLSRPSQSKR